MVPPVHDVTVSIYHILHHFPKLLPMNQLRTMASSIQNLQNFGILLNHQKRSYDQHAKRRSFQVGEYVWLSVPTAGKPDLQWEGGWIIHSVEGPTTYTITDK